MVRRSVFSLLCLGVMLAASPIMAKKLSKNAKALNAAQVKTIYAGKTATWSRSKAYFAPDGTFYLIGKKKGWYGQGKWTVRKNKMCWSMTVHIMKDGKKRKKKNQCTKWVIDGKKYLSLWHESDKKDGWYDGEQKKLRRGDSVTRTFKSLKKKFESKY